MKKILAIAITLTLANASYSLPTIKEEIAKSIVRVRSGAKYSTGFFWKNGNTVITTLHSLSKQDDPEVYVPQLSEWKAAKAIRVLRAADIVLLEIQDYSSSNYLQDKYIPSPPTDTPVFTIGYNSGNSAYQDRDFLIGLLQGNKLQDLLTSSAKKEIRNIGFPSLETEIVYLKGQLLHGFSGSPIVDLQGRLVGVADGGLENGAAGISWCISARSISALENSSDDFPQLNSLAVNSLFASEEYTDNETGPEYIDVGDAKIRKIKTRSFAQLDLTGNYSTFDEMGLNQLLLSFRQSGIDYSSFSFDVYADELSGATFVVPSGLSLEEEDGWLIATDGNLRINIKIEKKGGLQSASEAYEHEIMPNYNPLNPYLSAWGQDNRWSYLYPVSRPDGMIVRRKAFFSNFYQKYVFEALAGKENTFLGSCVEISQTSNPMNYQVSNQLKVAKFDLAVQLTTFSN
jgi:hypothetical protein